MPTVVAKYLVVAACCLFAFCGLFAGSAGAALANGSLDPSISKGLAWLAVVGCPVLALVAIPLISLLERSIRSSNRFMGYSLRFWQLIMVLIFVFGLIMGTFLPNGPFNGPADSTAATRSTG